MIKCNACGKRKSEGEFSFKNKKKGVRNGKCKKCKTAYNKKWYRDNRDAHLRDVRKRRLEHQNVLRQFVLDYLRSNPCVDCGEPDPVVLDFDHKKRRLSA